MRWLLIYCLLGATALFTWWLAEILSQEKGVVISQTTHIPNYFSKKYKKTELAENGLPKQEITADLIEHFNDDATTTMQNPVMTFFVPNQPAWVVKADSGLLSADRKSLHLNDAVYIDRPSFQTTQEIHVKTSNALVKPELNYLETNENILMQSTPHWSSGKGAEIIFKSPIIIKLKSKVKGYYVPS